MGCTAPCAGVLLLRFAAARRLPNGVCCVVRLCCPRPPFQPECQDTASLRWQRRALVIYDCTRWTRAEEMHTLPCSRLQPFCIPGGRMGTGCTFCGKRASAVCSSARLPAPPPRRLRYDTHVVGRRFMGISASPLSFQCVRQNAPQNPVQACACEARPRVLVLARRQRLRTTCFPDRQGIRVLPPQR